MTFIHVQLQSYYVDDNVENRIIKNDKVENRKIKKT